MGYAVMENPAGSPAPTKILLVFLCLVLFAYGVNGQSDGTCANSVPGIVQGSSLCMDTSEGAQCTVTCMGGAIGEGTFICENGIWVGDLTCQLPPHFSQDDRDPRCDSLPCSGCIGRHGECNANSEQERCESKSSLGTVWCGDASDNSNNADNSNNNSNQPQSNPTDCSQETLQEAQKWRALVQSLSESLGHLLGRRNLKNVNDVFEVLLDTMHTGEILNVKY
jgi:hypothetical protein